MSEVSICTLPKRPQKHFFCIILFFALKNNAGNVILIIGPLAVPLRGFCRMARISCDELLIFLFILPTGVGSQGQLYDVSVVLSQRGS